MPKLPELAPRKNTYTGTTRPLTHPDVATEVQMFISHRTLGDGSRNGPHPSARNNSMYFSFARAVRTWFDKTPDERAKFIKWYEAL